MSEIDNLKALFKFILPFKRIIFNLALVQIILSMFGVLGPWISKMLIDNVFASRDYNTLDVLVIAIVVLFIFEKCIHVLKSYYEIHFGQKLTFNIRKFVYEHIQNLDVSYFETTKTGEVVHRTINDVDAVSGFTNGTIVGLAINIFMLFVNLALMLYLSTTLAFYSLLFVLPIVGLILTFTGILKQLSKESGEKVSEIYGYLYEVYSGVRTIKIFSQEHFFGNLFIQKMIELVRVNTKSGFWSTVYAVIYSVIQYSGYIFVVWYGTTMIFQDRFTPGSLIAFISYYYGVLDPVYGILNLYQSTHFSLPAINRIYSVLNRKKEIDGQVRTLKPQALKGHITFTNVKFQYQNTSHNALDDISAEIRAGEVAALVGSSGAGKTTFVSLIPAFYLANHGQVRVDDMDVREIDKVFLRQNIGMVLQEPFLMSGTIMKNIVLGRLNATEAEAIQAAKDANIHNTIMGFPKQYDTAVGERGTGLSVGEKQRITIARAILKNPKILILDEPTSSVDSVSELLIKQALNKFMKNRTTIMIAHRLSTILHADKIIVFDKGKILGIGPHGDLVKSNQFYRDLYTAQFLKNQERNDLTVKNTRGNGLKKSKKLISTGA